MPLRDLERLIAIATGYQQAQCVIAAVKLGLFDMLLENPCGVEGLARKTLCNDTSLRRLLSALAELGFVKTVGTTYTLTRLTRKFLCRESHEYIGAFFLHQATLIEPWTHLTGSLRLGTMVKPQQRRLMSYRVQLRRYLEAMDCLGRIKAPCIARQIDLQKHRMMLDIGGGMGTYAVAFAQANRNLRAVVADLPDVIRHARSYIRKQGCAGKVRAIALNCLENIFFGEVFDLVFVSNLLHLYRPDDCKDIVEKAGTVLERGGTMVVHEYVTDLGNCAAALFDLTMLVGTPHGRCYTAKEIKRWMRDAGITGIRAAHIAAGTSILWGIKKGN